MIDVFVPVYNEGENIQTLLDQLRDEVKSDIRVLIVYDIDEDDTLPMLNKIAAKYPYQIVVRKNTYGRGPISAFRTGIDLAENEYLVFVMADVADDLRTIDLMREKMDAGCDVVVGSRYIKGGARHCKPGLKSFLSQLSGIGMHLLTGIPTYDISNAYRMYRTEILRKIPIVNEGHVGTIEILQKIYLAGYQIDEVPDVWNDRTVGKSKFKMWKWLPGCLYWCYYAIIHRWFYGEGKPRQESK